MRHYTLLAFFESGPDVEQKFIMFGVGNAVSVVLFPKYVSFSQARTDLMLRDSAIYGGVAKFETRAGQKDLSKVAITEYWQSDGRSEELQTNDLYLYLLENWRTKSFY